MLCHSLFFREDQVNFRGFMRTLAHFRPIEDNEKNKNAAASEPLNSRTNKLLCKYKARSQGCAWWRQGPLTVIYRTSQSVLLVPLMTYRYSYFCSCFPPVWPGQRWQNLSGWAAAGESTVCHADKTSLYSLWKLNQPVVSFLTCPHFPLLLPVTCTYICCPVMSHFQQRNRRPWAISKCKCCTDFAPVQIMMGFLTLTTGSWTASHPIFIFPLCYLLWLCEAISVWATLYDLQFV